MASVKTPSFLKSKFKLRLFNEKFDFGHKILYLKLRLFVKSRFVKSRLYCISFYIHVEGSKNVKYAGNNGLTNAYCG